MTIIKASKDKKGKSEAGLPADRSGLGEERGGKEKLMPLCDTRELNLKQSGGTLFSEVKLEKKDPVSIGQNSAATNPGAEKTGEALSSGKDETVLEEFRKKFSGFSLRGFGKKIFCAKSAVVIGALALICGALVINNTLTGEDGRTYFDYAGAEETAAPAGAEVPEEDGVAAAPQEGSNAYFSAAAVNRRRARDESLEVLQLVVDSEDALQESKDSALQSMSAIAAQIEKEANIESLIKAKGFEECIAVVGDDVATVIVSSGGLLANEVAQITEIVCEQTAFPASSIKIVEKTPV